MTVPAILAALSVAFPRPGAALPSVERCYVLGAAAPGTTNVVVSGSSFPVHPQGGWVAMAELKPGTNTISVSIRNVSKYKDDGYSIRRASSIK